MKLDTTSSEVDDNERSLATFSTSMFPETVARPSSMMSSGPSAATTMLPVKAVHFVTSDTSCDVLIVSDPEAGAQSAGGS